MRALAALALAASILLASADAALAATRSPTRLWYRLRITYTGLDRIEVTRHARGIAGNASTVLVDAAAELRPESAVLLRRRPGRTFSVLTGRELTGRLTRYDHTLEESPPHCSPMREQQTGVQLGRIAGSFGFQPVGRDRVELFVSGNATSPQLAGRAATKITRPAWMCDLDALQRDGLFQLPHPFWRGRLLSPPLTLPRVVGADAMTLASTSPSLRRLRTPLSSQDGEAFAIRVPGARFGARRFTRTARLIGLIPIETAAESGERFAREVWTLKFTRCPRSRPCE